MVDCAWFIEVECRLEVIEYPSVFMASWVLVWFWKSPIIPVAEYVPLCVKKSSKFWSVSTSLDNASTTRSSATPFFVEVFLQSWCAISFYKVRVTPNNVLDKLITFIFFVWNLSGSDCDFLIFCFGEIMKNTGLFYLKLSLYIADAFEDVTTLQLKLEQAGMVLCGLNWLDPGVLPFIYRLGGRRSFSMWYSRLSLKASVSKLMFLYFVLYNVRLYRIHSQWVLI